MCSSLLIFPSFCRLDREVNCIVLFQTLQMSTHISQGVWQKECVSWLISSDERHACKNQFLWRELIASVSEFPYRPLGLPAGWLISLTCWRQLYLQFLSRKGTTAKVVFIALKALFLKSAVSLPLQHVCWSCASIQGTYKQHRLELRLYAFS